MTRGRPFEPGNKFGRGRPKGSKNKSTSVGRQLLDEHHESLMRKNIAEGLKGDTKSRLWCLNQLNRETPRVPKLKLPPIKIVDDVAKALGVILDAVANQKCPPALGQALCAILGDIRRSLETHDLDRLDELEEQLKKLVGP